MQNTGYMDPSVESVANAVTVHFPAQMSQNTSASCAVFGPITRANVQIGLTSNIAKIGVSSAFFARIR